MSAKLSHLDQFRAELLTVPVSKVMIRFEQGPDGSIEPMFECVSCEDLLDFAGRSGWVCPTCGYGLQPKDARLVADFARSKLENFPFPKEEKPDSVLPATTANVLEKPRWAWLSWLLRLLRLRGA